MAKTKALEVPLCIPLRGYRRAPCLSHSHLPYLPVMSSVGPGVRWPAHPSSMQHPACQVQEALGPWEDPAHPLHRQPLHQGKLWLLEDARWRRPHSPRGLWWGLDAFFGSNNGIIGGALRDHLPLLSSLSEPELPRAKGGHRGPVQDRSHPRAPGHPLGRHGQPGASPEAAGRGHPHLWTHTQVWGFWERKQVLHQPWFCHRGLQCTGKVDLPLAQQV